MCDMKTETKEDLKEVNNTPEKNHFKCTKKDVINEIAKIGSKRRQKRTPKFKVCEMRNVICQMKFEMCKMRNNMCEIKSKLCEMRCAT